ncbi:MAG: NAD(P)/FAD-dependent oxidoreductase [Thermoplasmatota archaeon]
MSAALQLKKEMIPFDIFEKKRVGGLLWYAGRVDNLLGFRGKNGKELCTSFFSHLEDAGIPVHFEEVKNIEQGNSNFKVNGARYTHVILASGTVPRKLYIPGELNFIEEPEEFRSKKVLIVGGGDIAFDNGLRLRSHGAEVTILFRGPIKANMMLRKEAEVSDIQLIKGNYGEIDVEEGGYVFSGRSYDRVAVFIGRTQNLKLVEDMQPFEILLPSFSTTVKGLYVVGDAALGTLSQTSLASGSGVSAAMHIASMERSQ